MILLSVSMIQTARSQTTNNACEQLATACSSALKKADELLDANDRQILYLKQINKDLLDQIDIKDQKIIDATVQPWYSTPTTVFLIGIVTGGLIYGKVINR